MMRPEVTRGVLLAVVAAAATWMACGQRSDAPARLRRVASGLSRPPPYKQLLSKYPRSAVDLSTHQDYGTVRIGRESRAARMVWASESREMRLDVPEYPVRFQLFVAAVGGNVEYALDITAPDGSPQRVDWGMALDRWRRVEADCE